MNVQTARMKAFSLSISSSFMDSRHQMSVYAASESITGAKSSSVTSVNFSLSQKRDTCSLAGTSLRHSNVDRASRLA